MPKIAATELQKMNAMLAKLDMQRQQWRSLWRDLADFYLPNRYQWLQTDKERRAAKARNDMILDNTGTRAARTLAAGMMNGVTSPSRPWFKLTIPGNYDYQNKRIRDWLDEVERRMLLIFAQSNFYNALQTLYLDLAVFGTGAVLIYEDYDNVIHCYNPALGEYFLAESYQRTINTFSRKFCNTVEQLTTRWPDEKYWSTTVKNAKKMGGSRLFEDVEICHYIGPNTGLAPKRFPYMELYWESRGVSADGTVLEIRGYNELPGIFARWDATPNGPYGVSPAMDALGDVIQLQHETKKKGQALDKMVSPPVVAPLELQHKPSALLPNGITFVSNTANAAVKPIYTVAPPLGEMTADIREIQTRIQETFHNQLFNMISQLETVRTATEIDARREEKLVQLGGVLERFEAEALDPIIERVFGIMMRAGLLPEPPEELAEVELDIQYISILSIAQRAVGTAPMERLLQVIGGMAPIYPEARHIIDPIVALSDYAVDIGVKARPLRSPEEVAQILQQEAQQAQAAQAVEQGAVMAQGAENLSKADVGGGTNALQMLMGGA